MSERSRYEEYLICKERGHVTVNERGTSTHRGAPDEVECVKCGTWIRWTKPKLVERGAPEENSRG